MNNLVIERQLMMTQQILDIYSDDVMALSLELVEIGNELKIVLSDEVTKWSIMLDPETIELALENLKQNYYALKALNKLGFTLALNNFATIWSFKKYYNDCFVNVIVNAGNSPQDMLVSIHVYKPLSDKTPFNTEQAEEFIDSLDIVPLLNSEVTKSFITVHLLNERVTKDTMDKFAGTMNRFATEMSEFTVKSKG